MRNWLFTLILIGNAFTAKAQTRSRQGGDPRHPETSGSRLEQRGHQIVHERLLGIRFADVRRKGGHYLWLQGYLREVSQKLPRPCYDGYIEIQLSQFLIPGPGVAFVVGKFHLTRPEKGDLEGHYTLLFRKIKGKWLIVCDHTSG
jgi:hypothetical protein